jgi:hypothetical protein
MISWDKLYFFCYFNVIEIKKPVTMEINGILVVRDHAALDVFNLFFKD